MATFTLPAPSSRRSSGLKKTPASEARLLATLADVNLALSGARSPRAGLQRALEILTPLYGALRASVVLQDAETGHLKIVASAGLTAEERQAAWTPGEGLTGRVVQSGRPVVVPRIDQEPLFLPRTGPRRKTGTLATTFMCANPGRAHSDRRFEY